jgi:predicted ATPase/class 3 adenylate cyclase
MADLPSGTVTFLLTDVEGSTALWEEAPEAMRAASARHDAVFEAIVHEHGGVHIRPRGEGDSRFAVFAGAPVAVAAALAVQRAFSAEDWPTPRPIRVRMGLHTGQADLRDGDYYGSAVNRCARLRNLGHGGQILLSEATAALVRDDLPDGVSLLDLGQHPLRYLSRPERVFQPVGPGLPGEFPPLASADARPNNLPLPTTALIGREREVDAVAALLLREDPSLRSGQARLVTLTGPGGTGKTRLSLQVAADVLDRFEDGVWFVELAPISDPDLVAATIGQVLGVPEVAGRTLLQGVVDYLRARRVLLVLDNFEQILPAASVVDDLLRACAGLRVLVTSRAALQLRSEHVFPVPPLALPDVSSLPEPDGLSQYGAVALFIERATAIKPDFAVTNANAPAVAEICARLDGLPLAIELAAARIRLLPTEAMLARLGHGLTLLTGGRRDLPARQQTLRSAISWSYDLLTPEEQGLYRRLGMFVGGFTLEAAETIGSDAAIGFDVLDGVGSLVEKSLVRALDVDGTEPRFTMLETIREYALEQLASNGEIAELRLRHAEHFLALAEAAEPHLERADAKVWMDRLRADQDNLRAALTWSARTPGVDSLFGRLVAAIWEFWWMRGQAGEARVWLDQALATTTDPPVRSWLLRGAATLAYHQGDFLRSRELYDQLTAFGRATGQLPATVHALGRLAVLMRSAGDLEQATTLSNEALALSREIGDPVSIAYTLHSWALVAISFGDYERVEAAWEESLGLFRETDTVYMVAHVVNNLGRIATLRGDFDAAATLCQEALGIFERRGDRFGVLSCLQNLLRNARAHGDAAETRSISREILPFIRDQGSPVFAASALDLLAWAIHARGEPACAARLLGAAENLRETSGSWLSGLERARVDADGAALRQALGEVRFTAAWAAGHALTLDQAVAEALQAIAEAPGESDTLT